MDDVKSARQIKLERILKVIYSLIFLTIAVAIVGTFIQIYNINVKINSEVKQIQDAQQHNRLVTNTENNVTLSYLQCIATIHPEDRTQAIVNNCVTTAEKENNAQNIQ